MTSPIPLKAPAKGVTESVALSPSVKVFVAATMMIFGSVVAVVQARSPFDLLDNATVDPKLASAPLPVASGRNVATESLPALGHSPKIDSGNEKYAQAYPPPILTVSEKPAQAVAPSKSGEAIVKAKPFAASGAEFKPIHQFSKPSPIPALEKPDVFKPSPKFVSTAPSEDALLPLFHFAENIKPISRDEDETIPPENPFRAITGTALTPLVPLEKTEPLKPLVPLSAVSPIPLVPLSPD